MILLVDSEGHDQADPGLRSPHIPEVMFAHGAAHMITHFWFPFNEILSQESQTLAARA